MLELVVCGFQSGADIAGAKAARAARIPTGGWMPKGFKTEEGPRPGYNFLYNAQEHESPDYPPRTAENARMADVTLWFGNGDSRGYWCTLKAAEKAGKPFWKIDSREDEPWMVANRLLYYQYKVANIAGNRESASPGIEAAVFKYLSEVFEITQGDA